MCMQVLGGPAYLDDRGVRVRFLRRARHVVAQVGVVEVVPRVLLSVLVGLLLGR